MIIRELRIEDFKRIKAITIRPDGSVVDLTGRNGQGKTSVLEAIFVAMKGLAAAPPQPIREGAERATIHLDVGEFTVDREFKTRADGSPYTHHLTVTRADGSRIAAKPQDALSAMCGALAFDPLAFSRMKPKEQYDLLRGFVTDFDFVAHDSAQAADYDARTEANRRAAAAKAAAEAIAVPAGAAPEPVDIGAMIERLNEARKHNLNVKALVDRRREEKDVIENLRDQAEGLRAKAGELERHADEREKRLEQAPPLPEIIDVEPIKQTLSTAERVNATARAFKERERQAKIAAQNQQESERLTAQREAREKAKKAAIDAAAMPVDNLDLADGEVFLNGHPFGQAGTGEKIRTSTAIAMALNPKMRVILIDDGERLDREGMAILAEMAEKREYQIWMSRVDETGQSGFVIEDGALK